MGSGVALKLLCDLLLAPSSLGTLTLHDTWFFGMP